MKEARQDIRVIRGFGSMGLHGHFHNFLLFCICIIVCQYC
jgi:hypothetical protein